MTPEDPESRRIADELARRERRSPGSDTPLDPATLSALLEKHEGEVERIVGQAETVLAERIDTLANAQGAAAEGLRREIANRAKDSGAGEIAALERRLKEMSWLVTAGAPSLTKTLSAMSTASNFRTASWERQASTFRTSVTSSAGLTVKCCRSCT